MVKTKLPRADVLEKQVEGFFEIISRDENGEVLERFAEHNLITLSAYKQLLKIIAGDKTNTCITKFILGTDGVVLGTGAPKGDKDGFNINIADIFSIQNAKPYYSTSWEKVSGAESQEVSDIRAEMHNVSGVTDGTGKIDVNLYYDKSTSRVYFKCSLPLDRGNLTDKSRSTSYSEAALYIGDKIFSMKTFPPQSKTYQKTLDIVWSFKTIGDNSNGIEFRIDTRKMTTQEKEFTLPMIANTSSLVIDWGDGTEETTINPSEGGKNNDKYKHTYTSSGEFGIRIVCASVPNFDFTDVEESRKALVAIDSMSAPFQNANFDGMFENCVNLYSIPYSLFRYNVSATSFNRVFKGCTSLAVVPEALLETNTSITSCVSMFEGCSNLYHSGKLFSETTVNEISLNGGIITDIFKGTKASLGFIINVESDFVLPLSTGTSENIIIDWGDNKWTLVKGNEANITSNFKHIYENVTNLEPKTIRVFAPNVPKFEFHQDGQKERLTSIIDTNAPFGSESERSLKVMLKDCTELTTVPLNMFDKNHYLEDVTSIFENCSKLTGATFNKNGTIRNFSRAFWGCVRLKITDSMVSPEILSNEMTLRSVIFYGMFYRPTYEGEGDNAGTAPKIWTNNVLGTEEDELAFGGKGNLTLTNYAEIPDNLKLTFMQMKVVIPENRLQIDLRIAPDRAVSWGDGYSDFGGVHRYLNPGEYTIKMYGVDKINEWNTKDSDIPHILKAVEVIGETKLPASHTFEGCYLLEEVPVDMFRGWGETETNFDYTFAGCQKLKTKVDFSMCVKANSFVRTFDGCASLADIPNVFLEGVTNYEFTFRDCDTLTKCDYKLPAGVTTIQGLFYECTNLKTVPDDFFTASFDTLSDYSSCFFQCKALICKEEWFPNPANITVKSINFENFLYLSRDFDTDAGQLEKSLTAPALWLIPGADKFKNCFSPNEVFRNVGSIPLGWLKPDRT